MPLTEQPTRPTPAGTAPPEGRDPPSPRPPSTAGPQARFPQFMILLTVLATLAIVSLIYYRAVNSRFPTSAILLVPRGTEVVEGAEVTVDAEDREVARVTLGREGESGLSVLVEPGEYTLTVRYRGHSYRQRVIVPHRRIVTVPVTTQPTTASPDPKAEPAGDDPDRP